MSIRQNLEMLLKLSLQKLRTTPSSGDNGKVLDSVGEKWKSPAERLNEVLDEIMGSYVDLALTVPRPAVIGDHSQFLSHCLFFFYAGLVK